jgi:hypothetical protein
VIAVQLDRTQLVTLVDHLPRCPDQRGRTGELKVLYPFPELAEAVAVMWPGATVYRCPGKKRQHWHITTRDENRPSDPDDWLGTPRAVRKQGQWDPLMTDAQQAAGRLGRRIHVYGARTRAGRWVYRPHLADYRDVVRRTYA